MHLGGSVVSNHILENKAKLKWGFREDAVDELDNGWRFLSEIDTEEYLSNPENMSVCDWSTIVEIEPAVLLIYDMPIGTELTLIYKGEQRYFLDTNTGRKIELEDSSSNQIRKEMKVTIETELKRISRSLSLINDNQTFNKISSTNLENIDDILNDYLPLHLEWIEKGNSWIVESLSENHQLDRQAFSQLLVGVRNLYLDLEELQDLLIEVSNEIDGK